MIFNKDTLGFFKNTLGLIDPEIEVFEKTGSSSETELITIEFLGDYSLPSLENVYLAYEGDTSNKWKYLDSLVVDSGKTAERTYTVGPYIKLVIVSEMHNREIVFTEDQFYDELGNLKDSI